MYRVAQTANGSDTRSITDGKPTQTKSSPGMGVAFGKITPLEGVSGYRLISKSITPAVGIFQTGPLRAPSGPQTAFASEQIVDMLAEQAGMDPFAFRVMNMRTDTYGEDWEGSRWIGALTAAVDAAKKDGYVPHVPASKLKGGNVVTGWGMAIGTHHEPYGATVAKVTVNKKTGKITVNHLWGSQDSGFAVNPGLLENQMVGNLIQATSKVLHEELRFDRNRVSSRDWVTYPILRFKDAPTVTPIVVNRPDRPPIGAGEPPIVPTGAAIANAVYDATGARMTQAPADSGPRPRLPQGSRTRLAGAGGRPTWSGERKGEGAPRRGPPRLSSTTTRHTGVARRRAVRRNVEIRSRQSVCQDDLRFPLCNWHQTVANEYALWRYS